MITFVDINTNLVNKVKSLFSKYTDNKWKTKLDAYNGDIITYQKNNGGYIATASNPLFKMAGGLDLYLLKNYHEEIINPKEFSFSKHLFYTITVNNELKTNKYIIKRALLGCFAYRNKNIIISGFGTGIGGLSEDIFIEALEEILLFK